MVRAPNREPVSGKFVQFSKCCGFRRHRGPLNLLKFLLYAHTGIRADGFDAEALTGPAALVIMGFGELENGSTEPNLRRWSPVSRRQADPLLEATGVRPPLQLR